MKYQYLLLITLFFLASTDRGFAQMNESETGVGIYQQTLDGMNKLADNTAADQIPERVSNGNYFLFLGASGASVTDSDLDFSYAGGGCMQQVGNSQTDGDFDLSVQLPDGHQIRGFRYYWYDASTSNSRATLLVFDGTGGFTNLGSNVSTGNAGFNSFYLNLATDNIIVDNSTGYYVVRFNSIEDGNNQRMCGIRFVLDSNPA